MRLLCYINEDDLACYVNVDDVSAIVPSNVLTSAEKIFRSVIYLKSDPQLELLAKYWPETVIEGEVTEL